MALRDDGFVLLHDGQTFASGWQVTIVDQGDGPIERFAYAFRDAGGKRIPITALPSATLEAKTFDHGGKTFTLVRFFGSGSSGATYYSTYRWDTDGPKALEATEARHWGDSEPCRETPIVEIPPRESTTIFGACPNPERHDARLVFRMPGWHCSRFQPGGCPSEYVVPLR